jgi:hypothetical protein
VGGLRFLQVIGRQAGLAAAGPGSSSARMAAKILRPGPSRAAAQRKVGRDSWDGC